MDRFLSKTVSSEKQSKEHFARVWPIVGHHLRRVKVAVVGLPTAAPLVEYLAACGVRRWWWAAAAADDDDDDDEGDEGSEKENLAERLTHQHGPALGLEATALPWSAWCLALRAEPVDLIIAVGSLPDSHALVDLAAEADTPLLYVAPPSGSRPGQALWFFPGDDPAPFRAVMSSFEADGNNQYVAIRGSEPVRDRRRGSRTHSELFPLRSTDNEKADTSPWPWLTFGPLCAGLARAILLRQTPFARPDLEGLWQANIRGLRSESNQSPLEPEWLPLGEMVKPAPQITPTFQTPPARRGHLLIAGLGSMGSVAAQHLASQTQTMLLVDPEQVEAANPVRQAYPVAAIGQPKAAALRCHLLASGAETIAAIPDALTDEATTAALVDRYDISAALIVTGTAADFAIARALRQGGVPHVVGRCYPRARYWEAIVVDGGQGPALSDVRGRLTTGPAPPPTPEQIAAYSDAGALEAEPATLIESGWAAAWLARLTAQLLAPAGLRERWFLELLAAEQTCLIGGVGVEETPAGPAYGLDRPGQVRGWSRERIRS